MDLPLLSPTQPFPPSLQRHLRHEPPRRAPPQIHHHRVHPLPPSAGASDLPLRRGHMCGRGRAQGAPGDVGRQLESVAPECAGGAHYLRNDGESTLRRVCSCHIPQHFHERLFALLLPRETSTRRTDLLCFLGARAAVQQPFFPSTIPPCSLSVYRFPTSPFHVSPAPK